MDFKKEINELTFLIEDIKETVNIPFQENKSKNKALSLEEMEVLLHRIQEIIDKLNRKANEICSNTGISREEMTHIVQNPNNFGSEEWETIQQMQAQVDTFHKSLMQAIFQQKNEKIVKSKREETKKSFLKGKKNWIPL